MPQRSLPSYLLITLKGIAMGAADVIPGVSGGTIAFITGIYEELLETIANVNFDLLRVLRNEGLKAAWQKLNGNFILALLAGIAIAILSLAHLISWLLENKPIQLWSFFFGLVFASIFLVGKQVSKWSILSIIGFIIGAIIAFIITGLPSVAGGTGYLFYFVCGMIAICAMILPGISGSFILLLLGAYATIINAIKEFEIGIIGVFAAGCVVGILSFSKLLNWLFKHHRNVTISLLAGFLLGSLPKLWPWKSSGELLYTHSDGKKIHMLYNVLPSQFSGDQLLLPAVAFAIFGLAVIFILERFGKKA
jgi:putative membrane protein